MKKSISKIERRDFKHKWQVAVPTIRFIHRTLRRQWASRRVSVWESQDVLGMAWAIKTTLTLRMIQGPSWAYPPGQMTRVGEASNQYSRETVRQCIVNLIRNHRSQCWRPTRYSFILSKRKHSWRLLCSNASWIASRKEHPIWNRSFVSSFTMNTISISASSGPSPSNRK